MNYKLSCATSNDKHTTFHVFDRGTIGALSSTPAHCGTLTIQTDDLVFFLQNCWKGDIGLLPLDKIDAQLANEVRREVIAG